MRTIHYLQTPTFFQYEIGHSLLIGTYLKGIRLSYIDYDNIFVEIY